METNPRQEKGKEIAKRQDIIRVSDIHYRVHSQTTNREYDVIKVGEDFTCTCPDHKFRHVCCKHIHGVEYSLRFREEVRKQNTITLEPINVSSCPKCLSSNITKHGIRHNKYGDIQRYSCKNCHKRFSINIGFEKMRATPQAITSAMQLYFTGESLRSVQKFLRLQGVDVSHQTILNWITKYTKVMKSYLDKITPQVGNAWRADEVWTKVRGDLKYLFALIDDETRWWLAKEVATSKEKHDASGLFRQAKEIAGTRPKVIITDGLRSYQDAYKKEFWTINRQDRTLHIRHIHLKGDMNNNKMERFNGEFRDREKVMRGIKKDDSVIFDGYQIYHNYIREHQGLEGKTPADKVGIDVKGNNKWITLIQNAKKHMKKSNSE
ncbi:MAG: DDE-type integrase/transposase/recombinase [Nitrosarchaeum sp.]|nr:DDE-type integrase/transposase/recombinase [Nitrosarchaeum sp.]